MAEPRLRPEALLHALRHPLHGEFPAVWSRSLLGFAHLLSRLARCWRRWLGTRRASHSRGHVSATKTPCGICSVQHGHRDRAGNRPTTRWMDHRQLELALDFFY